MPTRRFESAAIVISLAAGAAALAQAPPPPPDMDLERREMRIEIRMDEGEAPSIVLNGEAIPPERLRRRPDGGFEILDRPDGEIIHVIPRIWEGPRREMRRRAIEAPPMPERPMVGVVMDRPDPLLVRHLRLDPDGTIMIVDVLPDSPAMEAGLEPGDLVVAVGDEIATAEALARAVEEAGADGEVLLEILQAGERRRVSLRPRRMAPPAGSPRVGVEIDEWDRRGFGGPWGFRFEPPVPMDGPDEMGMPPGEWREALEAWARMLRDRLQDQTARWRERWEGPWGEEHVRRPLRELREDAEREYGELMREMEHLEREVHERIERQMREMNEQWRTWRRDLDHRMREWRRDRETAEREQGRPRPDARRDARPDDRDRGRPAPPPPTPGRPA